MIMNYFCDTFLKEKSIYTVQYFWKRKKNFTGISVSVFISVVAAEQEHDNFKTFT